MSLPPPRVLPRPAPLPDPPPPPLSSALLVLSLLSLFLCLFAQALHQGVVKLVCLAVISTPPLAAFGRPSTMLSKPQFCTHTKLLSKLNLDRAVDGRPYTQPRLPDSATSTPLLAAYGRPSTMLSKPQFCTHTKLLSKPNLDRAVDGRPYTQHCRLDSETETDLIAD